MEREPAERLPPSLAPEHDWAAAQPLIQPALRPVGTAGTDGLDRRPTLGHGSLPLLGEGLAGLPLAYVFPAAGFDVVIGVDHLLSWGVGPAEVHAAAMANLAGWSRAAPWTDEVDGCRRVVWSESDEGLDAVRILLPDVRRQLSEEIGPAGRVLVGLPERHMLLAATLVEGDEEFAELFATYIAERFEGADEPIDGRLFELVSSELAEFTTVAAAS